MNRLMKASKLMEDKKEKLEVYILGDDLLKVYSVPGGKVLEEMGLMSHFGKNNKVLSSIVYGEFSEELRVLSAGQKDEESLRCLLSHLFNYCKERDIPRIILDIFASECDKISFYKRQGFEQKGKTIMPIGIESRIRMEKII